MEAGQSPDVTLRSWEEIAAHLGRDLNSVKRWYRREALPAHRDLQEDGWSISASANEISEWWNSRRSELEMQEQAAGASRRYLRWALAGAALTVGASVGVWLFRPSPIAFEKNDWLLVLGLANRTGRPIFEGTIRAALERALIHSGHLRIAPRERIVDALKLMRRPDTSAMDVDLGREVCLRDGKIRMMVVGSLEQSPSGYLLIVGLVSPIRGNTLARFTRRFSFEDDLPAVILETSWWVRERLGEPRAAIQRSRAQASTTVAISLRAMQLYDGGLDSLARGEPALARRLLNEAVAAAPGFAAAYAALCRAIREEAGESGREEAERYARRAMELSGFTDEAERHFILGSHYWAIGDLEKAIQAFQAQAALRPDHYGAVDAAARMCAGRPGQEQDFLGLALQAVEIRPLSPADYERALKALGEGAGGC